MISLDNINFYHHPPASKPPAHTSSSSSWKSYHVPSAPQSLSFSHPLHPLPPKPPTHTSTSSSRKSYHLPSAPQSLSFSRPLPPKPPTAVTAVPTSTIKGHFQYASPRNIFDIELEKVPTREKSLVERETDLEADHQSGSEAGNDLGDQRQDASLTLVTSSRGSVLPCIPAGTDDCEGDGGDEGGGNQLATRRGALQDQLDTCPQPRGDAVCSDSIVTAAEADLGYSAVQSVSAVDDTLLGDSDCQLSLSGREVEKQTTTTDNSVPKHHNSQLPSPALSNPASPENKPRAPPGQQHGVMFEDLPSEAACCEEQTRALTSELATIS
ncbi:hypothetical protein BDQ94DRAFT_65129 [Aspergillus welwitschiae]|uniref:Uncharacterized protein n=1 Tax=Aspergillus welwitschiae TaxID=1341132 RepID=A0A3F3PVA2_9EURO|nr:hypothetical protein BDQ94DRAFT_65129 [Aspergillus welwitschiae]RDH30854.1 hypothetical protein BDQ94DRAFT_65129 [Aspergillus welwitschiae]